MHAVRAVLTEIFRNFAVWMKWTYKILRAFLLVVLSLAVTVPVTLYILLSLPSVQRSICHRTESELTRLMGVNVDIDRISITPFNRVTLHDVNITGIQQLTTGGGGYWDKFHFINAQFLGNFVSQINLNAGIGVGGSVQQAKAGNVGFNAHAQNAALSDCVRGKAAGCGATLIAGGLIAAASCQSY